MTDLTTNLTTNVVPTLSETEASDDTAALAALARTIHSLCPHGLLYAFDVCPQRHHDEREATETLAGLRRRGFRVSEAISE